MRVVSLIFGLIGLLVVGCGSDLRCRDAEEIPLPGANYFPEGIAGDAEGRMLELVLKWREQRAAALESEVARLDKAVEEAEKAPPTGSDAMKKLSDEL